MNKFSSADLTFMRRALKLARRGRFTASPNPCVGCVIVRDGMVIAEGWHKKAGTDHAEAAALKNAGSAAAGATVYVTLEPCSHYGRTPPCAKALVKAGVRRVVAAVTDCNPKVSGRGMAILSAAGIKAEVGLCEQEALKLNRAFFKSMRTGLPWVRLKSAFSLDGKIALPDGQSKWITGAKARSNAQLLRAMSDAVITGVNTVLTDNPRYNVRYAELPGKVRNLIAPEELRQPLKVVLDTDCRLDAKMAERLNIFASGKVLQVCASDHLPDASSARIFPFALPDGSSVFLQQLGERHDRLFVSRAADGKLNLRTVLYYLGMLELRSVLVEGGSRLSTTVLQQGLADEIYFYCAPLFLGADSLSALQLPVPSAVAAAERWSLEGVKRCGSDVRLHYLKQELED